MRRNTKRRKKQKPKFKPVLECLNGKWWFVDQTGNKHHVKGADNIEALKKACGVSTPEMEDKQHIIDGEYTEFGKIGHPDYPSALMRHREKMIKKIN